MAKVKLSTTTIRIVKGYRNGTSRTFHYLPELQILNDGEVRTMTEQGYQAWLSGLSMQGFLVSVQENTVSYTGDKTSYRVFNVIKEGSEEPVFAELECVPAYYEWHIQYQDFYGGYFLLSLDDPDWIYDCKSREEVKNMVTEIIDSKIADDEEERIHLSKAERWSAILTATKALYEYYLVA